jgi:glycine oxidase
MRRRRFLGVAGLALAGTAGRAWGVGRRGSDVVVVGGGAIGATTAWLLRSEGLSVTLLDKGAAGREASWASAGMIQPYGSSRSASWSTRSALLSKSLYDAFEPRLLEETGRRVGYGGDGGLVLAFDDGSAESLRGFAGRGEEDFPTRFLDRADVRQREPGLPEGVVGAALFPGHRYLDARSYTAVVLDAAKRKGVEVREQAAAVSMLWDGGRVVGVKTKDDAYPAKTVILSAGAWSGTLDLKLPMPIRPVHGQILAVESPKGGLRHNLQRLGGAGGYATPRADGRIVVGATSEDFGFEKKVTPEGRAALAAMTKDLLQLAEPKVLDTWSGLRPGSADGSPAVGPDPRAEGVLWGAGHGGYGMMQGAATAAVLADLALQKAPRIPIDGVAPARFVR